MKTLKKSISIISILLVIIACKQTANENEVYSDTPVSLNWEKVQSFYSKNMGDAILLLDSLRQKGLKGDSTKAYFSKVRIAFKNAEPYASYLNPQVGHRANGPALPIYKEDSGKVVEAVGLQKLEETIYGNEGTENDFEREIYILKGLFNNLKKGIDNRPLNPQRFFIATHQQLLRLVSLSMASFDTPVSLLSIYETSTSLKGLKYVYENSIAQVIKVENIKLHNEFLQYLDDAILIAAKANDPNAFDRFTFIRNYLNPITTRWVKIRKKSNLWKGTKSSPINFDALTFFEEDSFNANFFQTSTTYSPSKKQIELGEKLFFEKRISKNGTMSCATCHEPNKGYTDGLKLGNDNMGNKLLRNTPTLLNSVYQKAFFWDGRSASIEDQISAVFTNKKEFNTNVHQFSNGIIKDTVYINLFKEAFGKVPKKNKETIEALSSYVATLSSFNSKFDKNISGQESTYTDSEKNGFNLYMGKALCATCHFIPLTNGTVPPFFSETEKEVIGVPKTALNKKLDSDLGFYWVFEEAIHKGMFKTPTVRNAALTAPYMHNGVYNTLEEVIDFYAKGGGGGIGFDLPHQTLPFDKLDLTDQDKKDLIAFIETLTDNSVGDEY